MKAVVFSEFGGPEVMHLADLPDPMPGPGEVVVDVSASTVNPTDLLMRSGAQAAIMADLEPPYIAGMEFAGRVAAVGAGVDLEAGAPVIGVVNPRRPEGGAYAAKVCISAASVAQVGENVDLVEAATVPMNALTATMALDTLGLSEGDTLLVTGATGILGGLVLEMARQRGLTTVATGRPGDETLLQSLGANVILPRDGDLVAMVRERFPDGVDGMVDGALIGAEVSGAVKDGGGAVPLRKSHPIEDERLNVGYVGVTNGMEDTETLRRIAALLGQGKLTPRVAEGGRFAAADAAAAHRMVEQGGFRGRVVITF